MVCHRQNGPAKGSDGQAVRKADPARRAMSRHASTNQVMGCMSPTVRTCGRGIGVFGMGVSGRVNQSAFKQWTAQARPSAQQAAKVREACHRGMGSLGVRPVVPGGVQPHGLHTSRQRALGVRCGVVAHMQHFVGLHLGCLGRCMKIRTSGLGTPKSLGADAGLK